MRDMQSDSDTIPRALSQIRVVLVEPSHPGNIGGAARALKTMGMGQLVVVNPGRFPDPQACLLYTSDAADESSSV